MWVGVNLLCISLRVCMHVCLWVNLYVEVCKWEDDLLGDLFRTNWFLRMEGINTAVHTGTVWEAKAGRVGRPSKRGVRPNVGAG